MPARSTPPVDPIRPIVAPEASGVPALRRVRTPVVLLVLLLLLAVSAVLSTGFGAEWRSPSGRLR